MKQKYDLSKVIFVIGGNLSVGEADTETIVPKYKEYGFDLVFHQVDLIEGLDEIEKYIEEQL